MSTNTSQPGGQPKQQSDTHPAGISIVIAWTDEEGRTYLSRTPSLGERRIITHPAQLDGVVVDKYAMSPFAYRNTRYNELVETVKIRVSAAAPLPEEADRDEIDELVDWQLSALPRYRTGRSQTVDMCPNPDHTDAYWHGQPKALRWDSHRECPGSPHFEVRPDVSEDSTTA